MLNIRFDISALRKATWTEISIRFLFGGAITVAAGLLAKRFGPAFGGLFLAFPAIFPAGVTLVEKHEREKKRKAGITRTTRGREAAALDAKGAVLGGLALCGFAWFVWEVLPRWNPVLALLMALVIWFCVAILLWRVAKTHKWRTIRVSGIPRP